MPGPPVAASQLMKSLSHNHYGENRPVCGYTHVHIYVHFHVGMLIMNSGFLQNMGVPQFSGDLTCTYHHEDNYLRQTLLVSGKVKCFCCKGIGGY